MLVRQASSPISCRLPELPRVRYGCQAFSSSRALVACDRRPGGSPSILDTRTACSKCSSGRTGRAAVDLLANESAAATLYMLGVFAWLNRCDGLWDGPLGRTEEKAPTGDSALAGRSFLVSRASALGTELADALTAAGAACLSRPDRRAFRRALARRDGRPRSNGGRVAEPGRSRKRRADARPRSARRPLIGRAGGP